MVFTIGLDLLIGLGQPDPWHGGWAPWATLGYAVGTSLIYVLSLMMLVAALVGASPLGLFRHRSRADTAAWQRFRVTVPLLLGTFAAYLGSAFWAASGRDAECWGAIDSEYFAQLSQVIPLLLVAFGIEARVFRRFEGTAERAIVIITVLTLCVAEVVAVTALIGGDYCSPILAGWHEYSAFIVTLEACVVALSVLAWVLLWPPPEGDKPPPESDKPSPMTPAAAPPSTPAPPAPAPPDVAEPAMSGAARKITVMLGSLVAAAVFGIVADRLHRRSRLVSDRDQRRT